MSLTSTLNYQRLVALKPTVYCTITNQMGQSFDLVEHPTRGDEEQVIILFHDEKIAVYSSFYDTEDMEHIEDYTPYYIYGEIHLGYEVAPEDKTPIAKPSNQNTPDEIAMFNHIADNFKEAVRLGVGELRAFYGDSMLVYSTRIKGDKVIIEPIDTDKVFKTVYTIKKTA